MFSNNMSCPCSGQEVVDIQMRRKYTGEEQFQYVEDRLPLPLKLRTINLIGLHHYMLNRFLFAPPAAKYKIRDNQLHLLTNHMPFFTPTHQINPHSELKYQLYHSPPGYTYHASILQNPTQQISVPFVHLKPITNNQQAENPILIYSHGNSSDLFDSIRFIQKLIQRWDQYLQNKEDKQLLSFGQIIDSLKDLYSLQFLIYDYTGYGDSRYHKKIEPNFVLTEDSIRKDLEFVIKSLNRSGPEKIILWGFSLGAVPTVFSSANNSVYGTILQAPFASIANCLNDAKQITKTPYEDDFFNNLEYIGQMKSQKIAIIHGLGDQVIPIRHSQILFQRYLQVKIKTANQQNKKNIKKLLEVKEDDSGAKSTYGSCITTKSQRRQIDSLQRQVKSKINFVRVQKLTHNGIHPYLVTRVPNELQFYFLNFIEVCCKRIARSRAPNKEQQEQSPQIGDHPKRPQNKNVFQLYNRGSLRLLNQHQGEQTQSMKSLAFSNQNSLPLNQQQNKFNQHEKEVKIGKETNTSLVIQDSLVNKMQHRKNNYF